MRFGLNILADQVYELVSILTGGRYANRTGPIIIQMAELVRESLYVVDFHGGRVV